MPDDENMSLKRTDLAKQLGLRIRGKMQHADAAGRFGGPAPGGKVVAPVLRVVKKAAKAKDEPIERVTAPEAIAAKGKAVSEKTGKAAVKKVAAKKIAAKTAVAKKAPAKKAVAKKAVAKNVAAKKVAAKKVAAPKPAAKKSASPAVKSRPTK